MNWAKDIYKNTPLDVCYRLGQTHKSYGWAKKISGGWNAEQIAAYVKGFAGEN